MFLFKSDTDLSGILGIGFIEMVYVRIPLFVQIAEFIGCFV